MIARAAGTAPILRTAGRLARLHNRLRHALWPLTLGVRGLVIDPRNRVLLVRHTYVEGWYLPGGGVEPGETCQRALARELEEEGGIRIEGPPVLHGLFLNGAGAGRDHVACYVVRRFARLGAGTAALEIAEADFFDIDRLPSGTTRATRDRINEILRGAPIGPTW